MCERPGSITIHELRFHLHYYMIDPVPYFNFEPSPLHGGHQLGKQLLPRGGAPPVVEVAHDAHHVRDAVLPEPPRQGVLGVGYGVGLHPHRLEGLVEGQQERRVHPHRLGTRDDRQQLVEPVVRARAEVQPRELYREVAGRPDPGRLLLD